MIDVAIAIDNFAVNVSLKSKATGSYDDGGNYVEGSETTEQISATIQPIKGIELKDLPEGIREEAKWIAWSRHDLENDDVIVHENVEYRVMYIWPRSLGNYTRAAIGMVE